MSTYFKPYEGRDPYIFISYAHRNSSTALSLITPIHEKRYRLWYDEGIPAGSDWPRNIAQHMRFCGAVLFFLSAESLSSPNCFNEIEAANAQSKPILYVRLDDAVPPARWAALLEGAVAVARDGLTDALLQTGIIDERFLGDGKTGYSGEDGGGDFNGWIVAIVAGILLLAATGVGAYGLSNGWFASLMPAAEVVAVTPAPASTPTPSPTPAPTLDPNDPGISIIVQPVLFPDALQARAIRAALGKSADDAVYSNELYGVSELHFIGNMYRSTDAGVSYDGEDGYLVNGVPVAAGSITDLSLLSELLALTRLNLIDQPIRSLSPLDALTYLTELSVAKCPVTELARLSGMRSLGILHLEHTDVKDLTPLASLPALHTVTVSADMFPLTLDPDADYDVILVN